MSTFFCSLLVDQNRIFSFAHCQPSLLESLKQYHAISISVFKFTVQVLTRTICVFVIIESAEGRNPEFITKYSFSFKINSSVDILITKY